MPELRRNKLTGEWVSIAEERAKRPSNFKSIGETGEIDENCPFCKGNEHFTSSNIYESNDGRVRVIANRYPVLTTETEQNFGIHEVIIDTNKHDEQLHDFSQENIETVLFAIKERLIDLKKNKKIKYIQVFKNNGAQAGASQPHSHWQILALPIQPLMQQNIYKNSLSIYKDTGECFVCSDIVKKDNCTDFCENNTFKAYCDFASKFCYEIHITSKKHCPNFELLENSQIIEFAEILKKSLFALNKVYKDLPYNICILNSFVNTDNLENLYECMHFYVQIIPRIGNLAGLEFSTSSYINSVPPEKAAAILKSFV